ncbi:hypothetical protein D3C81_1966930 [compost metagenome]
MRSSVASRAVRINTGRLEPLSRKRLSTSRPSMRGRPRSSTARSKISLSSECKALVPSCNQSTV